MKRFRVTHTTTTDIRKVGGSFSMEDQHWWLKVICLDCGKGLETPAHQDMDEFTETHECEGGGV